jgi:hypothetical protein
LNSRPRTRTTAWARVKISFSFCSKRWWSPLEHLVTQTWWRNLTFDMTQIDVWESDLNPGLLLGGNAWENQKNTAHNDITHIDISHNRISHNCITHTCMTQVACLSTRTLFRQNKSSHAGIWTRVLRVRAAYPNQLNYAGRGATPTLPHLLVHKKGLHFHMAGCWPHEPLFDFVAKVFVVRHEELWGGWGKWGNECRIFRVRAQLPQLHCLFCYKIHIGSVVQSETGVRKRWIVKFVHPRVEPWESGTGPE